MTLPFYIGKTSLYIDLDFRVLTMDIATNKAGQVIMSKHLCDLLVKAFAQINAETPTITMDLKYPATIKPEGEEEKKITCVAIQPLRDAADIMLAVGSLNHFATPPGIAGTLALFMGDRIEDTGRELKRAEHLQKTGLLSDMPPLYIFPRHVWNPAVEVPASLLATLKP